MNPLRRFLNALLVTLALVAPMPVAIAGAPQQERNPRPNYWDRGDRDQDHDARNQVRSYRDDRGYRHFYDPDRRQWHAWNYSEDRRYRSWFEEGHEGYRDFSRLRGDEQRDYFRWRHDRGNRDRDRY